MLVITRGACGITQTELARLIEVNQGKVSRWEDGLSEPGEDEIARLTEALGVPRSLFFVNESAIGAEVSFMYHRKRRRTKLSSIHRLHSRINLFRLGVAKLLRPLEDFPVLIENMDIEEYGNATEVARMARAVWKLPATTPVRNLVGLAESLGAIGRRCSLRSSPDGKGESEGNTKRGLAAAKGKKLGKPRSLPVESIVQQLREGQGIASIAKSLGVSRQGISSALSREGIALDSVLRKGIGPSPAYVAGIDPAFSIFRPFFLPVFLPARSLWNCKRPIS